MRFHIWLMHLKVQKGKGKRTVQEETYTIVTTPLRPGDPIRKVEWDRAITDSVWLRESEEKLL